MKCLSRVFVLAGVIALANTSCNSKDQPDQPLADEPEVAAPEKAEVIDAVQANDAFGVDLYQQLAKENPDKNLFFSPYSMSVALTMTAEGARRETAAEMGQVLRFPDSTKQTGAEAASQPWNMTPIHRGMQKLLAYYNSRPASAKQTAELEAKRAEFAADNAELERLDKITDWKSEKGREAYLSQERKTEKTRRELNALLEKNNPYELRVANRLYAEKTYPFQQSYLETINKFYGTGAAEPVDFIHDFENLRKQINAWVEKQTNDRIKDLLPAGSLNELTRLVLCNAIYFKGDWLDPVDAENTKSEEFQTATGTAVVSMMSRYHHGARYGAFNADGSFFGTPEFTSHGEDKSKLYPGQDGFLIAELPYKGRKLSMVVIVPQDAQGLAEVEKKLGSGNLQTWIGKLESRYVRVQLPKFKLETDYPEMARTLETLGMRRAFVNPVDDPDRAAQFEGMGASTDPRKKLYISQVCHKAFVEVNEKGTEAVAATASAVKSAESKAVPFIPTFRADKPFIFAIRDVKLGTILFLGRMVNPKE